MGILTDISDDYDDDEQVHRIYAVTRFGISDRASLNRVAGRAAVMTGTGQRSLVAAAYDEEGIEIVWREPFKYVAPEDKFEDAKEIDYMSVPIESASSVGDILPPRLQDMVKFEEFREGAVLHIWEIPYEVDR